MPVVQYPFIDIAVHERVREHFARGEAIVLFSLDLKDVYWANGRGAALFGKPVIYDLIEDGPNANDVTFRQVEASGRQLAGVGDQLKLMIRIPLGFQRFPVQAVVERIHLTKAVDALLFAAPVDSRPLAIESIARDMLQGFDDADTHMAVLGHDGTVLARSAGFDQLGVTPATARTLVGMAGSHPEHLVKRPVPTAKGYLPAAIGKVSEAPALHLLFAVETILGNMGPAVPFPEEPETVRATEPAPVETAAVTPEEETTVDPSAEVDAEVPVEIEIPAEPQASDTLIFQEPVAISDDEPNDEADIAPPADITDAEWELLEQAAAEEDLSAPQPEDLPTEDVIEDVQAEPVEEPGTDDAVAEEPRQDDAEEPPVEPVAEDLPVQPEAQDVPVQPVAEDLPVKPVAEDVPTAPVSRDTPVEPVAEEPPAQQPPAPAEDAASASHGFSFNRAARPTRFVWKIDADGNFSEVSSELAAAVGPHAESLAGTSFIDIANLLDLDPEGKIVELLGRRDTWSGKTIFWPIEGTALRAPVDLAALPTYRRNREFDGFRGFGIVRLSDAIEDPMALGLTLSGPSSAPEHDEERLDEPTNDVETPETSNAPDDVAVDEDLVIEQEEPALIETEEPTTPNLPESEEPAETTEFSTEPLLPEDEEEDPAAMEDQDAAPEEPVSEVVDEAAADEPAAETPVEETVAERVEPPVFRSTPAEPPREEENIIRLEDRRIRGREGLTPGEQEAFREIARQLETLQRDKQARAEEAENNAEFPGTDAEQDMPDEAGPDSLEDDDAALSEPTAEDTVATEAAEEDESAVEPLEAVGPVSTASESEQLEILAASIPPRTSMEVGLSASALNEIPVALLIQSGDRLIHANPEFLKLSGYRSLEELDAVGGLDSLLHHKDLEDMPEQSGGLSLVRADDQLVPVTARLQSIRWDGSNALLLALIPSGARPVIADPTAPALTDAEEARLTGRIEALEGEVEELRSILETATDGVVIIGPDGEIRSMNRSASALFDYDEAETRGKPFVMLFAHESHRAVADYLAGMTGHGVASVLNDGREVIGREASGGFIPLFMTIGKLSASSGFCAVIRDITQWKRSEEDLKAAKRAAETANAHKSDFLARVSHEIRTPLNAIIGFSDMMAIEHFGPIGHPRYVEYANDIARSGRLVLDIVNDLLDISKIEAGEMELEFTAVGLNDAISEAVSLVQPQAHAQRVIIRTGFSDAVPDVVADLRSIKQIVLNILANAIRFTPAGGQIVVSTSYETNGSVVLRIRDTGVGMTRAELEQAMKPFRQVAAGATRKRGDGTGLGLPLTKAMVDANRASFSIQSAPNEGTLVEITFPSPRVLAN